jgi:hypothetical protein
LKGVLSDLTIDNNGLGVDIIVSGNDGEDDLIVPNDITSASLS